MKENLDSAIDVYISRVNGIPCASTQIHLFKGEGNSHYQEETELFRTYVKGNKEAKARIEEHPNMGDKFKATLKVRDDHMRKDLPVKYAFVLQCCYKEGCTHPICMEGKK